MANVGKELLDVPLPAMVKSLAAGIAEAQFDLDMMSMRLAQMMSGQEYEVEDPDDPQKTTKIDSLVEFDGKKYSLLELGFTPTFYQFVDTIIEVKMSISTSTTTESIRKSSSTHVSSKAKVGWGGISLFFGASASMSVNVSSVSASYSNKYQYSAEGASLLRTKLVPVPAPAILEERIRMIIDRDRPPE